MSRVTVWPSYVSIFVPVVVSVIEKAVLWQSVQVGDFVKPGKAMVDEESPSTLTVSAMSAPVHV